MTSELVGRSMPTSLLIPFRQSILGLLMLVVRPLNVVLIQVRVAVTPLPARVPR